MKKPVQSLPAWTYLSAEFLTLEKQHLFDPSWQLICHQNDIPEAGDYVTFDFLGRAVFALRDGEGAIGVFYNVCQHRGSRLLDDAKGNLGRSIICPYHAWTYGLDGALKSVPANQRDQNLDMACLGLRPAGHVNFMGFLWTRSGEGPSLQEQFAPVRHELEPYRFRELQPTGRVTLRTRKANWKTIADNYVDIHHVAINHPGLRALFGSSYGAEVKGDIHRMWGDVGDEGRDPYSVRAYKRLLPEVDWLPEARQRHWCYYRLWPNLAFDIYPDQVDFMQFIPISANETLIREISYAIPDQRREMKAARYLNWRINRQVNKEDALLIERVEQGMRSGGFESGPFSRSEVCLIDSANRIRHAIPIANQSDEPTVGPLAGVVS